MKKNDVKEIISHWSKNIFKYFVYVLILGIIFLVLILSILFISNIENKKFVTRYSKHPLEIDEGYFSIKFNEGWKFEDNFTFPRTQWHTVSVKLKVSKRRWKKVSSVYYKVVPEEILFVDDDGFLVTSHTFFYTSGEDYLYKGDEYYFDIKDDSTIVHNTQWDFVDRINYENYRKIKTIRYSLRLIE